MALPVIRTSRLIMRPYTQEDVDAQHALWTEPEVRRYLWDDVVIGREVAQKIIDSHLATVDRHGIGYWGLYQETSDHPVAGFCGFRFIYESPDVELMYGLRAQSWGKGLATEACRSALSYLWERTGFLQVYARTDPPNIKSIGVMQRLGMTHVSTTETLVSYILHRPSNTK